MNKAVVMKSIARYMEWIYEIKDLHDAYMELRSRTGSVVYVQGIDMEVNNVDSIYMITRD